MAIDEHLTEHARGAMIGLAIGDALGMPTQSMSAERIIECYGGPVRRLMDAVPQQPIAPNMKAGSVTDDTEQAFVLAARLIEDHGRIDNDAYAQDLLRWEAKMKEKGSLDLLGPSTKAALQALVEGVDPELTGRFGTTNGGAMRATPVGIAFIPGNALAEEAWRSCVVTHNTMQGIESTTLVAAAVSLAIAGERGFLSKALAFVEAQPPRGNWSAKASVVARVKMFMEWAVREDGSMSDANSPPSSDETAAPAWRPTNPWPRRSPSPRVSSINPPKRCASPPPLAGTPTPSPRSPERCSAHGMVRTASTRICADRCCASSKTMIGSTWTGRWRACAP